MVTLAALPEKSIVDGFKGIIDFYVYRGTPCARSWPRTHWESYTPAAQVTATIFGRLAHEIPTSAPEIRAAALAMAADSPQTWKDTYTSILLGGTYGPGET